SRDWSSDVCSSDLWLSKISHRSAPCSSTGPRELITPATSARALSRNSTPRKATSDHLNPAWVKRTAVTSTLDFMRTPTATKRNRCRQCALEACQRLGRRTADKALPFQWKNSAASETSTSRNRNQKPRTMRIDQALKGSAMDSHRQQAASVLRIRATVREPRTS